MNKLARGKLSDSGDETAELVRRLVEFMKRQIQEGKLSQRLIAQRTGYTPAAISNMLSRKKEITLYGFSRLLLVSGLTIADLMGSRRVGTRSDDPDVIRVPLVRAAHVLDPVIKAPLAIRSLPMASMLGAASTLTPNPSRIFWTRFIALRRREIVPKEVHFSYALSNTLLIDRHSFEPTVAANHLYLLRNPGPNLSLSFLQRQGSSFFKRLPDLREQEKSLVIGDSDHTIIGRVCGSIDLT